MTRHPGAPDESASHWPIEPIGRDGFANVGGYLPARLVVALALLPDSFVLSIIAGIDPKFGHYASVGMTVINVKSGGSGRLSNFVAGNALLIPVPSGNR